MAPLSSQYYIVLEQLPLALPVNGGKLGPFLEVVIVLKMRICGFCDAERPLSPSQYHSAVDYTATLPRKDGPQLRLY